MMKFAYADPPYIGQASKHYAGHPDYNGEVDHERLIADLCAGYDGWALSCSAPSLTYLASIAPPRARVGIWIKPFAAFKVNVNPGYAWEPVICYGGRKRTREQLTLRDWVSAPITLKRGLVGVKPDAFCFWVFEWLNLRAGDDLQDLYPGSGAVTRALAKWRQRMPTVLA